MPDTLQAAIRHYLTELSEVRLTDFKESVYLTADSSI